MLGWVHVEDASQSLNINQANIQTSATLGAELRQPMVAEVSLFQVAEVPTNMYDYPFPKVQNKML